MPICSKCKTEKPLSEFILNKSHRSGHNPACKACDITTIYRQVFAERGGPLTEPKCCSMCKLIKPYDSFGLAYNAKDGLAAYCKSCVRSGSKQRYYLTTDRRHREPVHVRFYMNVDCTGGADACWPWLGQCDEGGYGVSKHTDGGKRRRAHQVAWELMYGDIPEGQQILHQCDNPPCVRFHHLFLGTQQHNMHDAAMKGRMVQRGPVIPSEQVPYIRAMKGIKSSHVLAGEFGVTRSAISAIWNNRTHKNAR